MQLKKAEAQRGDCRISVCVEACLVAKWRSLSRGSSCSSDQCYSRGATRVANSSLERLMTAPSRKWSKSKMKRDFVTTHVNRRMWVDTCGPTCVDLHASIHVSRHEIASFRAMLTHGGPTCRFRLGASEPALLEFAGAEAGGTPIVLVQQYGLFNLGSDLVFFDLRIIIDRHSLCKVIRS